MDDDACTLFVQKPRFAVDVILPRESARVHHAAMKVFLRESWEQMVTKDNHQNAVNHQRGVDGQQPLLRLRVTPSDAMFNIVSTSANGMYPIAVTLLTELFDDPALLQRLEASCTAGSVLTDPSWLALRKRCRNLRLDGMFNQCVQFMLDSARDTYAEGSTGVPVSEQRKLAQCMVLGALAYNSDHVTKAVTALSKARCSVSTELRSVMANLSLLLSAPGVACPYSTELSEWLLDPCRRGTAPVPPAAALENMIWDTLVGAFTTGACSVASFVSVVVLHCGLLTPQVARMVCPLV